MSLLLPVPISALVKPNRFKQLLLSTKHGWDFFVGKLGAPPPSDGLDDSAASPGASDSSNYQSPQHETTHEHAEESDEDGLVDVVVVDNKNFSKAAAQQIPDTQPDGYQKSAATSVEDIEQNVPIVRTGVPVTVIAIRRAIGRRLPWPAFHQFAHPRDMEPIVEDKYWREKWFTSKRLSLIGSLWFVVNWILAVSFARRPFNIFDNVYFYFVAPVLVLPLPFMVMADLPRGGTSHLYQIWLLLAVWSPAVFTILDIYLCGFYRSNGWITCSDVDFLSLIYYSCALPAIALFALHQNRFPAILGVVVLLGLLLGLVVPDRVIFIRHVVELGVFHAFHLYVNYIREDADRRVFGLKEQIKLEYLATQKAQVAERKGVDLKRRLTNYIFHEVRVPLNTATLAFQNLEASGVMNKENILEFTALGGSLGMMTKVLSDILDYNRMDSGHLASVERPYNFHKALRSMLPGARVVAEARGLQLVSDLDPEVDLVAKRAFYTAQGLSEDAIQRAIALNLDDAIVVGDEMRLRQVVTNLLSNALKFNTPGPTSKVTLRTRLITRSPVPLPLPRSRSELVADPGGKTPPSDSPVNTPVSEGVGEKIMPKPNKSIIVVRIEVQDTGVGIKPKDMSEHRLFSPYVQTEIGRSQGGKGTGLGLALVRYIVGLSGGRLGVISKPGEGSTFWVEFPLGVGTQAVDLRPQALANSSAIMGQDWPRNPYPPSPTTNTPTNGSPQTPVTNGAEAGLTPSTPGPSQSLSQVPTDYMGHLPERYHSAPLSSPDSLHEGNSRSSSPILEVEALPEVGSVIFIPSTIPGEPALSALVTEPLLAVLILEGHDVPVSRPPIQLKIIPKRDAILAARGVLARLPSYGEPTSPRTAGTTRVGEDMHILVVDDDNLTRRLMSRMLERLGCQVQTAEDGQVALTFLITGTKPETSTAGSLRESSVTDAMLHENHFHVIFLDNQMPKLSGVQATKKLRAFGRKDFVVGVTGNALLEDQREYLGAGADRVLIKPVREESLKEMLVLARKRYHAFTHG